MKSKQVRDVRVIVTDLDETLLRKDKTFSEYSRDVIRRLIEKGFLVVPASGRDLKRMGENILTMPGIRYAITLNGAQVYELPGASAAVEGTGEVRTLRRVAEFPLSEEQANLVPGLDAAVLQYPGDGHRLGTFAGDLHRAAGLHGGFVRRTPEY